MTAETEECALGSLVGMQKGYAFKSKWYSDSGREIVKVSNFTEDSVDASELVRIPESIAEEYSRYKLKRGDIIVQTVGSWPNNPESVVGKVVRIPNEVDGALLNQNAVKLVPRDKLDNGFLFCLLRSERFKNYIAGTAQGAANQASITLDSIRNFSFSLPKLSIQRKIAAILSAYDDLLENNLRRIKILKRMAQTIYREWFVKFRFPGHQYARFTDSSAGRIPEGWGVKAFSEMASYVNGYAFKPDDWGKVGKPIIKIKELKTGTTAETPRNLGNGIPEKYHVNSGDVLFSWSADLNVYVWIEGRGLLNQHLFNVVPFDGFSRVFCFHALKEAMPLFRALSLGATMHHIKRSALDQVSSVVPTVELRKRFDALIEPIHRLLITLTKQVLNLRRTRDLLLPRLISGDVDVAHMVTDLGL
ncbi:MAG: restriction endonuclease subunit S [Halobacteriota archaeon]